jgi:hypothetical protein
MFNDEGPWVTVVGVVKERALGRHPERRPPTCTSRTRRPARARTRATRHWLVVRAAASRRPSRARCARPIRQLDANAPIARVPPWRTWWRARSPAAASAPRCSPRSPCWP